MPQKKLKSFTQKILLHKITSQKTLDYKLNSLPTPECCFHMSLFINPIGCPRWALLYALGFPVVRWWWWWLDGQIRAQPRACSRSGLAILSLSHNCFIEINRGLISAWLSKTFSLIKSILWKLHKFCLLDILSLRWVSVDLPVMSVLPFEAWKRRWHPAMTRCK